MMRSEIKHNITKLTHGKENYDMIGIGFRGSSAKEMLFGSFLNYIIYTTKIPETCKIVMKIRVF